MRLLKCLAPLACVCAVLLRVVPVVHPAAATPDRGDDRQWWCRLYLDPVDKFTRVPEPEPKAGLYTTYGTASATTASITVNYDANFNANAAAKAAFQAAINIWQTQVTSTIPIVIDASFVDLGGCSGGCLLGQAGPVAYRDFPLAPTAGTWFPKPIADAVTKVDVAPGSDDIPNAQFNSNSSVGWYFGTDGLTPSGQVDFESVVLHEVGHGLGFIGAGTVSGTLGTVLSSGFPYTFDRSVSDNSGVSVLNTTTYPDNSTALGSLMQSGTNLRWNGTHGVAAYGGVRPVLYAPSSFQSGSTYSHLDENTYPAGNANSLMTPQLGKAEAIHSPGPIMLGIFQDEGWPITTCAYSLSPTSATVTLAGGSGTIAVTASTGCGWSALSNNSFITITGGASGSGNGTVSYSVSSTSSGRSGTITIAGLTFTVNQGAAMALDRTSLSFAAASTGAAFTSSTGAQTVHLTQSGTGTVTWTASSNASWLTVSPTSGTGSATLTINVQFAAALTSSQSGSITFAFTGAANNPGPITSTLTVYTSGNTGVPFGSFDTPANGTGGVTGSIAVTGWALDDIGVSSVSICRDAVTGEAASANPSCANSPTQIFIGTAVLVDGARSDVAASYPTYPNNTKAGWGYLMLTNFLPSQGNGTFNLHAYAADQDGHVVELGSPGRTITCTNNTATTPFGAIDTPAQGATVSGTLTNFGWVLIKGTTARADVPGGGTVNVVVDGLAIGSPSGWTARSDITGLFPSGYNLTSSAVANFAINTTTLTNAVHTIAWGVTASNSQAAGIGSRYFTVSNGALYLDPTQGAQTAPDPGTTGITPSLEMHNPAAMLAPRTAMVRMYNTGSSLSDEVDAAPYDGSSIQGRRGFDLDALLQPYRQANGLITIQSEELDRIELHLSSTAGHNYTGYLRIPGGIAPLPIGSTLDAATGTFTWQPGVGFVGPYDFVFVRWSGGRAVARQEVRIVLNPKGSGRVGPQVVIDTPRYQQDVAQPFTLAGWAADLDSTIDDGVDTVHVWAYPLTGEDPIFLGTASFGGVRPDVAAVYGDRFKTSGYGLIVDGLVPGNYDIAVFAYSTVQGGFVPAKVVRLTVR